MDSCADTPKDEAMTTRSSTYPLRLPVSLKQAVERLSRQDGTSINQFVVLAVAEKIAVMTTDEYFADRRGRADLQSFDRIMSRSGGEPPRRGDEPPLDRARSAGSKTRSAAPTAKRALRRKVAR